MCCTLFNLNLVKRSCLNSLPFFFTVDGSIQGCTRSTRSHTAAAGVSCTNWRVSVGQAFSLAPAGHLGRRTWLPCSPARLSNVSSKFLSQQWVLRWFTLAQLTSSLLLITPLLSAQKTFSITHRMAGQKDDDSWTPLHYAAWYGREGIVKILLEDWRGLPAEVNDNNSTG